MNRKKLIIFISGIVGLVAAAFLPLLFQQEVPKNTIRILVDKVMDAHHIRLEPLLQNHQYTFIQHEDDFDLIPLNTALPKLQFQLVKDENTRALIFLKGEADVLYDSLSIAKTEWLKKQPLKINIQIFLKPGEAISKLALNSESKQLQDPEIKKAIKAALPLKLWTDTVFMNWVDLVEPENAEKKEPAISEFKIPKNFTLHYLTTSSREGQQMAFLTREALGKIGIDVKIHIYEPSLFYSKIRKREFDLYSSTALPGIKNILDLPFTETIPLFCWKHGLILNSRVIAPAHIEDSFDYSFRFLSELKLQSRP